MRTVRTAEELERALASGTRNWLCIYVSSRADIPRFTAIIQRFASVSTCSKVDVSIDAEIQTFPKEQLLEFFEAIGNLQSLVDLELCNQAFAHVGKAKLANMIQSGQSSLKILTLRRARESARQSDMEEWHSKEEEEKAKSDITDFFLGLCRVKSLLGLIKLQIDHPMIWFLKTLARLLPDLKINHLDIVLMDWNNDHETLESAWAEIESGLEANHTLRTLRFTPHMQGLPIKESEKVTDLLSSPFRIGTKTNFLLYLNRNRRNSILSTPLDGKCWTNVLAGLSTDDPFAVYDDPSVIYYYLRKNTWMFPSAVQSEESSRAGWKLVEKIKRLKADAEAEEKAHKIKMEQKYYAEIGVLASQMDWSKTTIDGGTGKRRKLA